MALSSVDGPRPKDPGWIAGYCLAPQHDVDPMQGHTHLDRRGRDASERKPSSERSEPLPASRNGPPPQLFHTYQYFFAAAHGASLRLRPEASGSAFPGVFRLSTSLPQDRAITSNPRTWVA